MTRTGFLSCLGLNGGSRSTERTGHPYKLKLSRQSSVYPQEMLPLAHTQETRLFRLDWDHVSGANSAGEE